LTKPCLPPAHPTKNPVFKAPRLSCDSHTHIFDDFIKYPLSPNRSFTPPEAPTTKLLGMLDVLGIDRAVIVHSSAYGPNNASTLNAVKSDPKRLN
jgi:predicted TIM-barrel fold metal-dependent hydrolase